MAVIRRRLLTFQSRRAAVGPDGALYIADSQKGGSGAFRTERTSRTWALVRRDFTTVGTDIRPNCGFGKARIVAR